MGSANRSDPPQQDDHGERRDVINNRIFVAAIIIYVLVLGLIYATFVTAIFRRWRREDNLNLGLDPATLAILPRFVCQLQNVGDDLNCSICRQEYVENDATLRLPNCGHSFHEQCITLWLQDHSVHSDCPLCRTNAVPKPQVSEAAPEQQLLEAEREQQVLESEAEEVLESEAEQQVFESARTEQVSATISEPISRGIHDHLNNSEQGQSSSCGVELNLENITDISSRNSEMDEGPSDGTASILALAIDMLNSPDGFSSPVETKHPCTPVSSDDSAESDNENNGQ